MEQKGVRESWLNKVNYDAQVGVVRVFRLNHDLHWGSNYLKHVGHNTIFSFPVLN